MAVEASKSSHLDPRGLALVLAAVVLVMGGGGGLLVARAWSLGSLLLGGALLGAVLALAVRSVDQAPGARAADPR